jgi:hypothetical protein
MVNVGRFKIVFGTETLMAFRIRACENWTNDRTSNTSNDEAEFVRWPASCSGVIGSGPPVVDDGKEGGGVAGVQFKGGACCLAARRRSAIDPPDANATAGARSIVGENTVGCDE